MKRQLFTVLALATLALAQANAQTYTLKEPEAGNPLHGEMTVTGKSLGTIRVAISAALMRLGWNIQSESASRPPMPAYGYAAVKYPTPDPNKRQGLFVDIDISGNSATITADWYLVAQEPKRPKPQAKAFYDSFFALVVEGLKAKIT